MRKIFIIGFLLWLQSSMAGEINLESFDQKIPFSSLKGKWVFINYWASWCAPCLDEIPTLNAFYKTHSNEPIVIFGVNYEGFSIKEQKQLIQDFNLQYPSLTQDPAEALKLGHVKTLPTTFVFDPNGHPYEIIYGGQTLKSLNRYYRTITQNFVPELPSK